MIHEELEWCDVCEDCAQYKALGNDKYLCVLEGGRCNGYFAYKKLKAENAELRARLEKAVELPRIIHPNKNEWHIQYKYESGVIDSDIRFSIEAAKARLKEIKEKNND